MSQEIETLLQRERAAYKLYVDVAREIIVKNKEEPMNPKELAQVWDELRIPFEAAFKGYIEWRSSY